MRFKRSRKYIRESTDSGNEETSEPETVTITSLDGNGEETQVEVPYRPERAALLDMASLDIIDSIGEGDCVVGSATTSLDYLQDYVTNENIKIWEPSKKPIWKQSWKANRT